MIFGVGIDILKTERVSRVYAKYGDHFLRRLLMPEELELFRRQKRPERFLAMRFAAKEAVVKAMGRVFMTAIDDPFRVVLDEIAAVKDDANLIFVDFHAEATSEKVAMGWYLDGRVACVVGTHTHVQTADDRVLPNGTAYITDVGMTGPHDSVIGVERGAIIQRFLTALPQRFETASENPRMNAILLKADERTGRALSISRLNLSAEDLETLAAQPAAARG